MPVIEVHQKVHTCQPLLGKVPIVSFMDYNIKNADQFPAHQFSHYAETKTLPDAGKQ
jgi:hypothetical protein